MQGTVVQGERAEDREALTAKELLRKSGFSSEGRAHLWSRNGKDFVRRFPKIAKAIASLPKDTAIDGEIDADGKPSFALLQGTPGAGPAPVVLYAFDLLMMRRKDLRASPLEERR